MNYKSERGSAYEVNNILEVEYKIMVDIIKGDDFVEQTNIDTIEVLSLNTQGTEMEVLEGLVKTFGKGKIKSIMIEVDFSSRYGSEYGLLEVERFMREHQFELFDINLIKNILPIGIRMVDLFYVHKSILPGSDRLS